MYFSVGHMNMFNNKTIIFITVITSYSIHYTKLYDFNIGIALAAKHRNAEAVNHLSAALKPYLKSSQTQQILHKNGLSEYFKMGNVYENEKKIDEAIEQYRNNFV